MCFMRVLVVVQQNETEWDEYTSCHKLDSYSSAALRGVPYIPPVNSTLPQCIDWRAKNVVTKVKNQVWYNSYTQEFGTL